MSPWFFLLLCAATSPKAPQGFSIQKVSPEQTTFPMFAALDDRGRLFVTESSGGDLYKELQIQSRKCRIRLLEDNDNDGVYETSTIFKDNLVFPMGIAWRDGKLYVPDPPDLLVLEDTNNDGVADKSTKILSSFGHQDNGSLHGITFGPDGLLYMTTGNPDGYKFQLADGKILSGESGSLIRCNPDGSNPEVLCRGFENLVEIVFMPNGQIIGTDNWFQRPSGGKRDALVQLIPGGLYPLHLRDKGTAHVVSGEPLPAITMFPAVALSGLVRYQSRAFPSEYHENLFSAQHNARCVGRHIVKAARAGTFTSEDSQFITSDDPDFHPSDVLEDVDGSLLVVDTGGWYVQHCPTGKIRNSRAPGGTYRVRFDAAKPIEDPRGKKIDWDKLAAADLVKLLADPRIAVSQRAQEVLIARGTDSIPAIADGLTIRIDRKSNLAVWALARIGSEDALAVLRKFQEQPRGSFEISLTARAIASTRDKKSAEALEHGIFNCGAGSRLGCIEALAVCGRRESIPVLWRTLTDDPFNATEPVPDSVTRFMEHAVINALYHLGTADDFRAGLTNNNPRIQRAALILLDQPTIKALRSDDVFPRLSTNDEHLRATAQSLLKSHSEWSDQALAYFQRIWSDPKINRTENATSEILIAFGESQNVIDWLGRAVSAEEEPTRAYFLLEVMSRFPPPKKCETWIEPLRHFLSSPNIHCIPALSIVSALGSKDFDRELKELVANSFFEDRERLGALRVLINRQPQLDDTEFNFLLRQFMEVSPQPRFLAAEIAARAQLTDDQFQRLLEKLKKDRLISPDTLLPLFSRSANAKTAPDLLAYLKKSIDSGWRPAPDKLEPLKEKLGDQLNPLLDQLREFAANQQQHLTQLEPLLQNGNPTEGRKIFFSTQVACSTCHRIGPDGGQVGPDLTKVGAIRSGRDILESIVFPSSTIAQGYDNYIITLKNNHQLTGLIADKSDTTTTLRDSSGALRILRNSDIKSTRRETTSLMPQGLNEILTPDQFRDLLAFLQSLR